MSADHEEEWASSEVACSEPPWGLRQAHGLVTCHGALVLVGGFSSDKGSSNDVWRSTNGGQDWVELANAPWSARDGHCAVVRDGSIFVISGADQDAMPRGLTDVWRSDDGGAQWVKIADWTGFAGRWQHGAAVVPAGNALIVAGGWSNGYLQDVWTSTDGADWMLLNAAAPFGPRAMHGFLAHRGVLYCLGGFDGKDCLGDVWASVNGKRWTRVCLQAPWLPRHSFAVLSVGKYMYLFGGKHERATGLGTPGFGLGQGNGSSNSNSSNSSSSSSSSSSAQVMNDVWRSVDGSLWELLAVESPWPARYGHAAAVMPALPSSSEGRGVEEGVHTIAATGESAGNEGGAGKQVLPRIVLAGGCGDGDENSASVNGRSDDAAAGTASTASDVWSVQFRAASAFAGHGSAQGTAGGGGWDGGGGGELANSGVPLSGVPLSMQAVVSSVVELYRLRAGLEEVQKGNALIVKLVANAASLEVPPEPSRTSSRKSNASSGLNSPPPTLSRGGSSSNSLAGGDTDDDYQDAAADDDDDDDMPPHEVLPDQDDETDNNNDVVSGALSFVGNASPHSPIRHSSVQQRQELVSPPSPLPPAAGAVTSPVPSKPNNGRSTSAESLSAALASAAGDLEANPSLIAEDGPSGAVNATREERAALHALQEQVRQAAWATAGFRYASIRSSCSPTNRAAASAASKEREGEKESGDDVEWLKLAQLVETRSAFVATTRAGAINRLAALRKQAITPKVWYERLEHGKKLLTEALRQQEMPAWQASPSSSYAPSSSGGSGLEASAATASSAAVAVAAAARAGSSRNTAGSGGGSSRGARDQNKEVVLYEDAVKELHALTQAPRQSGSLRSATDAALRRLQDCLDLRAKAAREMIPHSASQFPDEDGRAAASLYGQQIMSTSIDMASAAKAVAWSQLWDNDEVLGRIKVQVHSAVGLELRKIPLELTRALELKAKLLPAALRHLDQLHDTLTKKMSTVACAEAEVHMWVGQLADMHKLASSTVAAPTPAGAAARSARKPSREGYFDSSASESEDAKEAAPLPLPPVSTMGFSRDGEGNAFAAEGLMCLFGSTSAPAAVLPSSSSSTEVPTLAETTSEPTSNTEGSEITPLKGSISLEQQQLMGSAALASASWVVAYFADRVAAQKEALYNAEDAVTDARSLYEKAFRRRKGANADRRGGSAATTGSNSNSTPTSAGGGGGVGASSTAVDWFSSMGNTIAGVFNGTEEVASLAQALAEASSNLKVAKLRLRRTMGRAARLAHAFAPELVAVLPTLVDPRSHRLRLVPGLTSAGGGLGTGDDMDDDNGSLYNNSSNTGSGSGGGNTGSPTAGSLSGSGVLPWLGFDAYTNVALYEGYRGTRGSKSEAAVAESSMSQSESHQALHSSPFSRGFALDQALQTSSAFRSSSNSNKRSVPCTLEWVLSATRASDNRKVLLKGFGARKSYLPKRPFKSMDRSGSSMDCSSNSESGNYERQPLPLSSPNGNENYGRSRLATEDDMNSGYGSEDEEESELERLLAMPLHPSIAGPSALVDSLLVHHDHSSSDAPSASTRPSGWSPLADALSTSGSGGGGSGVSSSLKGSTSDINEEWDASLLSALAAAPQPLFWIELPFPHPGTTLVEWVLHPAAAPGTPSSQSQGSTAAAQHARSQMNSGAGGGGETSNGSSSSSSGGSLRSSNASSGSSPLLRSAWEVQHMARLILAILAAMHGAGHSHGALHPTAVEVEEGSERVRLKVLPACLLRFSREYLAPELLENAHADSSSGGSNSNNDVSLGNHNSSSGALQPPLVAAAAHAADMFAFGVLLHWMHLPDAPAPVPGALSLPPFLDANLRQLLTSLLEVDPSKRPSAADAMLHGYFTASFSDRLVASGDLLRQDEKLEAVRALVKQVKYDHRDQVERISVHRLASTMESSVSGCSRSTVLTPDDSSPSSEDGSRNADSSSSSSSNSSGGGLGGSQLVRDVLAHFGARGSSALSPEVLQRGARSRLRVTFEGEGGVDEGGLATEMFRLFFEGVVAPDVGLFEARSGVDLYLPKGGTLTAAEGKALTSVGRAIVKAFYEGKRVGSRFAPSFFKYLAHGAAFKHAKRLEPRALDDFKRYDPEMGASLEWVLTHSGAEDLGLNFEELPGCEPCPVTDLNKADFVRRKVRLVLMESRVEGLEAVRTGFWRALLDLSPEASPFLKLLSATDWSLLLCGENDLTPAAVKQLLVFKGYPSTSRVPTWLPQTIDQFSPDNLRRFLIFCTGSPSLPPAAKQSGFEIGVQYCRDANGSLPVAHTCFFKLDLPDYSDQELFVDKLMKSIQECGTFDRV